MRTLLTLAIAAILAAPAGCSRTSKASPEAAVAAAVATVPVAAVESRDVARRVEVTGTLAAWEEAVVSLEAEGRLVEVRVDLGDHVKKGDVLLRIAPQDPQFRLAQAQAEQAAAESDFVRTEGLAKRDMATRQQVDEARRRQDVARTAVDLARKKLTDTTLRAPIDGTVSKRMVNLGEYGKLGNNAFQLVRTMPLKLRADVPERYASDVKVGDPVDVTSESFRGTLPGRIVRIGPAVAQDSRSFPIEAEVENADDAVKPGTFVRAALKTDVSTRTLTVPDTAVILFAGNPRVFVVADGHAKERPVELVGRDGSRALIGKGLAEGDQVVVSGAEALTDGMAVVAR
jgi:membrane fusion protein (multidrug efflux system)